MNEPPKCELCGEPMPAGEEMFKLHGYSGPCPKSPLPPSSNEPSEALRSAAMLRAKALVGDMPWITSGMDQAAIDDLVSQIAVCLAHFSCEQAAESARKSL